MLDILVVAPHPDDAEIGMGGSIARFLDQGLAVGVLDLTDGEPTPHGTAEIRRRETAAASAVLGLRWRENLGLPNRSLEPTLAARRELAAVIRRERPRWLFAPYWHDAHPDHVAASRLVEAARFWAKLTKTDMPHEPHYPQRIYYYFCTHLRIVPRPAFVLDISEQWPRKLAAMQCYKSQLIEGREQTPPTLFDRIEAKAITFGWTIGVSHGEPFACREPVGLSTMQGVL